MNKKIFYDNNFKMYVEQLHTTELKEEKFKINVVVKNLDVDFRERKQAESDRKVFLNFSFV